MNDARERELTAWRSESQAELERAQSDLADAQRRVDATQERLALLERLLYLETQGHGEQPVPPVSNDRVDDLLDSCERIIRDAGKPLHISELLSGLKEAGVSLPGRGTEANVIVRLRRAPERFTRTGRGTYGLPEFGLPELPTRRRMKRKRKRTP